MNHLARLLSPRTLVMIALCCIGIVGTVYALETVHMIGIARADTEPVSVAVMPATAPVVAPMVDSPMSTVALVLAAVAAVLGGLSMALHIIAPRTKTTLDDRVLTKIDDFLSLMRGVALPVVTTTDPLGNTTTVKLKESGRVSLGVIIITAVAAMLVLPLIGCDTLGNAPGAAKDAVIDCAKADVAAITVLVSELGADAVTTAIGTGQADWHKLEQDAIAQGKVIGGCALAQFVAALGKSSASSPAPQGFVAMPAPADDGRAALERFRSAVGGGRWSTEPR